MDDGERLLLRIRSACGSGRSVQWERDLELTVRSTHSVGDLCAALQGHLGVPLGALASVRLGVFDPSQRVLDVGIASGDELVALSAAASPHTNRTAVALTLATSRDHRLDRIVVLEPGLHTVGRAATCEVVTADRCVSRRHSELTVDADGAVTIVARIGAQPALLVNGREVVGTVRLTGDDVVAIGTTAFRVRVLEPAVSLPPGAHRVGLRRTPHRSVVVTDRATQRLTGFPAPAERRRLQVWSMLAPLAAGLALFAFSRQVQFLALTLISPLAMFAQTVDDRRSGRRSRASHLAAFRAHVAARVDHLHVMRSQELAELNQASPATNTLARRAAHRSVDLWNRNRDTPEFLDARLGVGQVNTRYTIEVDGGGTPELRGEVLSLTDGLDVHDAAPIVGELRNRVTVIQGTRECVDGLLNSLVVQAACLHSPHDLAIIAAIDPARRYDWIRWLPHAHAAAGCFPVGETPTATEAMQALTALQRQRATNSERWPQVLAVIDADDHVDPALTAQLFNAWDDCGLAVLWLTVDPTNVPHQAHAVVQSDVEGGVDRDTAPMHWWTRDRVTTPRDLHAELFASGRAEHVARQLAPLVDLTPSSVAGQLPAVVGLFEALGVASPTVDWLLERWSATDAAKLPFVIGCCESGPLVLDLVDDGPHALIGGTSGSGKSELLQSMVASLISGCGPNRLNLLFVDFKGGAAFQPFAGVPHTAGYVTNLDDQLADRALVSLRAELRRRMVAMEGVAKDLAEFVTVAPHRAPPALVIVVDEFATLVAEVPGFMAGLLDVAQRGRSLGIHLVLATQRPAGSVNDNILANMPLRVSLRVLDRSDSRAVVGTDAAADISAARRGRAVVRWGTSSLATVQTAYAGAAEHPAPSPPRPIVRDLHPPLGTDTGRLVVAPAQPSPSCVDTQLAAFLTAVRNAGEAFDAGCWGPPWCPPLGEFVRLDTVPQPIASPPLSLCCGIVDLPHEQRQSPLTVDLEEHGGLLVFGGLGAGKTTCVTTAIAALHNRRAHVAVIAFDGGRGALRRLAALPEVVDIVQASDLEAVTRTIVALEHELERRTRGEVDPQQSASVLVVIDDWGSVAGALSGQPQAGGGGDRWPERLAGVVIEGRSVGIHAIVTSDRRAVLPGQFHSAFGASVVLRLTDPTAYVEHGIAVSRLSAPLPPGRGWWCSGALAQIAVAELADEVTELPVPDLVKVTRERLRTYALPERCDAGRGNVDGSLRAVIGIEDVTGEPAIVDLEWSHLAVVGPARSGRSTALAALASSLAPHHRVVLMGPARSGLATHADGYDPAYTAFGTGAIVRLIDRLCGQAVLETCTSPLVCCVDDVDRLDDPGLDEHLQRLVGLPGVRLVGASDTHMLAGYQLQPIASNLRRARRVIGLQPDDPAEWLQIAGVRVVPRPGLTMRPGRGVLIRDRAVSWIQIAQRNHNVHVFDTVLQSGT